MRRGLSALFLFAALLIGIAGLAHDDAAPPGRDSGSPGKNFTGSARAAAPPGRDSGSSGKNFTGSARVAAATPMDSLIRIRLFSAARPQVVLFTPVSGDYVAEVIGMEPFPVAAGEPVLLFSVNGRVGVKSLHLPGVMADGVRFSPATGPAPAPAPAPAQRFTLAIPGDTAPPRIYGDGLSCSNDDGIFLLLNETTIENYLPGVVRTEGGTGRPAEFYKAQAVLARTYAWLNLSRHTTDGYHLCDDVHCQASYGVTDEKAVVDAVRTTAGLVVTGSDSVLVQAAYHSNCGGQTASAADAWLTALPHLQSITDPYCVTSRNSSWSVTIPAQEWQAFLERSGFTGLPGSPSSVTFEQKSRKPYFEPGNGTRIAVTAIRNEFSMRSSFFSLSPSASSVVVNGRGYGHGVGLCQEGAMVMASRGHTWREIIAFYYRNVLLLDISVAKFPVPVR